MKVSEGLHALVFKNEGVFQVPFEEKNWWVPDPVWRFCMEINFLPNRETKRDLPVFQRVRSCHGLSG